MKELLALNREVPGLPHSKLAKLLVFRHDNLYPNIQAALKAIRSANIPSPALPEEVPSIRGWAPLQVTGNKKISLAGDIHVPYQDNKSVTIWIKETKNYKPDIIHLNGDAIDAHCFSFWERDLEQRNFKRERKTAIRFFSYLRDQFPDTRIIYVLGNHEERYIKFMTANAPEYLGIKHFNFEEVFQLNLLNIEVVGQRRPVFYGKLVAIHGHQYRSLGPPVNVAKWIYTKTKQSTVVNHFHVTHTHSERTIRGKDITSAAVACLAQLRYTYDPTPNHNQGFALIETFPGGQFQIHNQKIIQGRVV